MEVMRVQRVELESQALMAAAALVALMEVRREVPERTAIR